MNREEIDALLEKIQQNLIGKGEDYIDEAISDLTEVRSQLARMPIETLKSEDNRHRLATMEILYRNNHPEV